MRLRLSLQLPTLTGVAMATEMNAGTLSGTIAVDVEYFGMVWGNVFGRFLIDSTNNSGPQR